ncbi:STAS domain-containing protein [Pseudonocardia sp.]|uniref:STAS domain-containing protein n=1 Tax=Pseudonocardia sp. TaxID=60912 RepID=UPI002623236D|nr:STAS domain-containing protein [Pseudonocardia sp.]MCW2718249.1 anti-sigma factor antagonist [Pseudonocardia sp.]
MPDAAVLPFRHDTRTVPCPILVSPPQLEDLVQVTMLRLGPDISVLRVTGEIDILTASALEHSALTELATGLSVLVVDLRHVTFFGASGVAALLNVQDESSRAGATLYLSRLSPSVQRAMDLLRITDRFDGPEPARAARPIRTRPLTDVAAVGQELVSGAVLTRAVRGRDGSAADPDL